MTHPFEKAGLGKAPFRCIGVEEMVFTMPDGESKAGGACQYCGTGIRWAYQIKSSDGAHFHVGCDCVEKTGIVEDFDTVRKANIKSRREAGAVVRREQRAAKVAAERLERLHTRLEATEQWRNENAVVVARLRAYNGINQFLLDSQASLALWGRLTERQASAVVSSFAATERIEAQRANSKHVGQIGKRIKDAQVRVTACFAIGKTDFYPFLTRYVVKLETVDGNVLTWYTTNGEPAYEAFETASFSVKEHNVYDGVHQTIITRLSYKKQVEVEAVA
jgi:hypothetical protein